MPYKVKVDELVSDLLLANQFKPVIVQDLCSRQILSSTSAPDDFAAVMEDLVFGADIDLLCVNITATGDDVAEGMENFTLALASDNNDVILMPEQADVEILDSGSKW